MSKRAEMRRLQKESEKMGKLANNIGVKVQSLETWAELTKKEMHQNFCVEFNDRLYEAEGYVSLANVIISCIAINMTWGYKQAIGRFISNLNPAKDYVKQVGVKKAFDQICSEYALDLGFDHFDIEEFIQKAEEAEKEKENAERNNRQRGI